MSLYQKDWIVIALLGAGLLLAVFSGGGFRSVLGGLLIFAGLISDVVLIRCPHCGVWLGRHPGKYCKNCGAEIDYHAKT